MKDLGMMKVERWRGDFCYAAGTLVEKDNCIYEIKHEKGGLKETLILDNNGPKWQRVCLNGQTYYKTSIEFPHVADGSRAAGDKAFAEKPPLGVMPQKIHDEQRNKILSAGISRYLKAGKEIPIEWVDEFNEIITRWAE